MIYVFTANARSPLSLMEQKQAASFYSEMNSTRATAPVSTSYSGHSLAASSATATNSDGSGFNDQTSQVLVNGFAGVVGFQLLYFAFVRFGLEGCVMPRLFREVYRDLTIVNQRSFTAHVLWLVVKLCILPAAWPFVQVFFCGHTFQDPLFRGTSISNADYLGVVYFAVLSMFLFELIYRLKISPVSLIHHTAGCALGVWQVVEQRYQDDATTELQFRLLMLYGVFEVVFETFPHAAVIFYRCQPATAAGLRRTARVWLASGCSSLVGTTTELVVLAMFMWRTWGLWALGMRVVLPLSHVAFMAAQVYGARVGFQLHVEFRRRAAVAWARERAVADGSVSEVVAEKLGAVIGVDWEAEEEAKEEDDKEGVASGGVAFTHHCRCCCRQRESVDGLELPLYPGT